MELSADAFGAPKELDASAFTDAKPVPSSNPLRVAADIPVGVASGFAGLINAGIGLGDVATGGAVSRGVDAAGELADRAGVPDVLRPTQWQSQIQDFYSPETKRHKDAAHQAAIDASEQAKDEGAGPFGQELAGFGGAVKGAVENPLAAMSFLTENYGGMKAIAKGTEKALAHILPGIDKAVASGLMTQADADARIATLAGRFAPAGEGILTVGQNAQQLHDENLAEGRPEPTAADYLLQVPAGLITGAIAHGVNRIPGLGDAETTMALNAMGKKANTSGSLAARAAKGFLSEGVLQEGTQSPQEQFWQNIAENKPWYEGMGEQAAQGILAGGPMGSGASVMSGLSEKKQEAARALHAEAIAKQQQGMALNANEQAILRAMTLEQDEQGALPPDVPPANPLNAREPVANSADAADILAGDEANDEIMGATGGGNPLATSRPLELVPVVGPLSAAANLAQRNGVAPLVGQVPTDRPATAPADGANEAPTQTLRERDFVPPPTGSFGQMNEFADLLDAERADVQDRRDGLAGVQQLRRESALESADARVADAQMQDTNQQRDALLQSVLDTLPEGQNPARAFGRALRQSGFANTFFRPEESARIAAWKNLVRDIPAGEEIQSAPNELDPSAFGIKEKPTKAQKIEANRLKFEAARAARQANQAQATPSAVAETSRPTMPAAEIISPIAGQTEGATTATPVAETLSAPVAAPAGIREAPAQAAEQTPSVAAAQPVATPEIGPSYPRGQAMMIAGRMSKQGLPTEAYPHPSGDGSYALRVPKANAEPSPASATNPTQGEDHGQEAPGQTAEKVLTKRTIQPAMRRDDLVGAILRVTGGKGIAANMAETLTGDTTNRVTKLRGLFTAQGQQDMDDLAMLLREQEGYAVRDGAQLEDLVREAAAGNVAISMARQERDAQAEQDRKYRNEIRAKARKFGVKTVAVKFSNLENIVLARLEERHNQAVARLDEHSRRIFEAAIEQAMAAVPEDVVDETMAEVSRRNLHARDFWNEATRLLRGMIYDAKQETTDETESATEPAGRADDSSDVEGNRPTGIGAAADQRDQAQSGEEFELAGQTADEVARQEAARAADEAAPDDSVDKQQADAERDAVPFSLAQESQPKPQGVQTGLFTPDGRVSAQAKAEIQAVASGLERVAQRQINAGDRFIDSVMEQFGLSNGQAKRAWNYFVNNKLVKVDSVGGQYTLVDGRLWNAESMRLAANGDKENDKPSVDAAAHEAATSPHNDMPEPTEAQQQAGNYQKGHVRLHGLDISIENPQGSKRSGVDADGKAWENTLANHYGYIRRTEGNDGDHVDVFIGEHPESEQVFILDQKNPKTGAFDEHKVLLGFDNITEAKAGYARSYAKGWMLKGVLGVTPASLDELKAWLKDGDMSRPYAAPVAAGAGEAVKEASNEQSVPDERIVGLAKRSVDYLRKEGGESITVSDAIEALKMKQRALTEEKANWSPRDANGHPVNGVRLYTDATHKKLDAIAWAITNLMDHRKRNGEGGTNVATSADEARSANAEPTREAPNEDAPTAIEKIQTDMKPEWDSFAEFWNALVDGKGSIEDVKKSFATLVDEADAFRATIAQMKNDQLKRMLGWSARPDDKKANLVRKVYENTLARFTLNKSAPNKSWTFGEDPDVVEKRYNDQLRAVIDSLTDADLAEFRASAEQNQRERDEAQAKQKAAIADPQTLDDFRLYIRSKVHDGMSETEARRSLTLEQRLRFDTLLAESTRDARQARLNAMKAEVRSATKTTTGEVIETKHTKTGVPLFVVKAGERVERDVYNQWNATAKRLGGWYSSFRGNGAVPGFQFKTREAADAFQKFLGGDTAAATDIVQERRDAFADDRGQSAVERLSEMADRLEERADEELGRERKANTERRARMAAGAEAAASADKALAKTMRNIAGAIDSGKAKFLDAVRQKKQVEMLAGFVRSAKDAELRAKHATYLEQERRKGEPATAETADYAEFPSFTAFRSDLASLARQLIEVEGTKQIGAKLLKGADDVTTAYLDFARANLLSVSQFGRADQHADFASRDDAEKAIRRSKLVGKAIVLPVKRGQNRVILSPSEAIERKVWQGDSDKRLWLSREFGMELVQAIGRRANTQNRLSVPWQFENAADRLNALSRMGIETPAEFRSALREFIGLQEQAKEADRVKMLERAMVGRAKDGLDFFPTSPAVVEQMIEAADIKPDMAVLEPEAGMGHIADGIRAAGAEPDVVELSNDRAELLEAKGYRLAGRDFLELKPRETFTYGDVFRAPDGTEGVMRGAGGMGSDRVRLVTEAGEQYFDRDELVGVRHQGTGSGYDRILMNPPFSDRRDAEHVQHAYTLLRPGGRLVAIMGEGVFFGQDKKAQAFRDWLDAVGGTSEKLPEGSFMDPSLPVNTGVNARLVVIDKGSVTSGPVEPDTTGVMHNAENPEQRDRVSPLDEKIWNATQQTGQNGASDILGMIREQSDNPINRALADALLAIGIKPKISADMDVGDRVHKFKSPRYAAAYDPKSDTVFLFTPKEVERHLLHELVHAATIRALEQGGMASAQMKALFKHVKSGGKLEGFYGMTSVEEFVAEAFSNPKFQAALDTLPAPIGSKLKSAWQWFKRIVARVLGWKAEAQETMLDRVMDVGAQLMRENSELSRQADSGMLHSAPNQESGVADTIDVDGTMRPTINSDGKPIAATEQAITNFWRWFDAVRPEGLGTQAGAGQDTGGVFLADHGTTRGLDASGRPRVFYHGTAAAIDAFDLEHPERKDSGWLGRGVYLTTDPQLAESYANLKGGFNNQVVMPLYAAIKTPYYATLELKRRLSRASQEQVSAVTNDLIRAGYDGVVLEFNDETAEVVAFSPEQVKSASGNSGEFDPGNPDIRYNLADQAGALVNGLVGKAAPVRRVIGDSGRSYDAVQRDFFKNVGRDVEVKGRIEKTLDYLKSDFWKKMAVGLVDQFRGLRDLQDGGQAYLLARLSKGTAGAFDVLLHNGKLSIRDGVYDGDTSGGFVDRLGAPLHGELDDFLWYVAANRAEKLTADGKENLFSPQDIAAGKSLAAGSTAFDYTLQTGPGKGTVTRDRQAVYADALRVFNEFQKNTLDLAEQSGLIDGASRPYWESEFYVPFYRVSEEDGEFIGAKMGNALVRQQAFKKLKGGTDKLNSDLLSNTLLNWSHLIEASAKNRAAQAALTAAEKVGGAHLAIPGEKNAVWYMDGGRKVEYKVDDPFVMTAITSLEYAGMRNGVMDAMTKFKHFLTIGVTASPAFKVRNLIRDSIQAIGTSDLGYNPITNIREGFKQTKRDSQDYVSALASGGLIRFGTMLEGSESSRVRQLIRAGVKDSSILNSESKWRALYDQHIDPLVSAYNELGNRSEEINRAALYNQLIKQGKSHAEAALLARDLMDFSMQGSFNTIRFLGQVVPFFNARLQGMYKIGRAAYDDPKKMAVVIGAVALASLALMGAYGDDDDWKRREDWDRDNFWWFKLGGIEFRIPKPFEVGAVASLAERSMESLISDEMTGERFRNVVVNLAMNNLSMNPIPQMIKPIVDLYANKDSFTGRPIETMGMQKLDPTMRFNSNTSMPARGLSAVTLGALSPVQYDHLARAYFGWLGSFVVGGADLAGRAAMNEPTQPALDYFKFATQGILKEQGTGSSRYVTMLYDQATELEQAYGTYRQLLKDGKIEDARTFAENNADKLRRYRSVEAVKGMETKLNQAIHEIERGDLSADEKKIRIDRIQKMKERAAQRIAPGVQ